jgi:hypothetical protein
MSELLVRRALEKQLAGMASNLTNTVYENEIHEPAADEGTPYQQVFFLPAKPDNPTQGPTQYRANGVFQVSLKYPLGDGPGAAAAQAELLRARFKRGTTMTESGLNVLVLETPAVARGFVDQGRWHVPVSISWQAWVTVP